MVAIDSPHQNLASQEFSRLCILEQPDEDDLEDTDTYLIALQPPSELPGADTDQDSDASDCEATADPNHLPRRLLAAEAELVRPPHGTVECEPSRIDPPPPTPQQPEPSTSRDEDVPKPKKRLKTLPRKWTSSTRRLGQNVPLFQETMGPTQIDLLKNTITTPS